MCRNNSDINLVLMDVELPEMDGYEATHQIRQFNKNLIIIAQTAFGLTGDKERALEAGCNPAVWWLSCSFRAAPGIAPLCLKQTRRALVPCFAMPLPAGIG